MNYYKISVRVYGNVREEDPKCPSYWRGSGCYDIDVPVYMDAECDVLADTHERAEQIACNYDYSVNSCVEIDDVEIKTVKCMCDETELEGIIVEFGEWRNCYDDDTNPDDYYEERRENGRE